MLRINAFDWQAEFKGIMAAGGFDAVIGNPPYVRQEMLIDSKSYFASHYAVYASTADLYVYFVEKAFNLLKANGLFGYIFSNKWMRARYGQALRAWIKKYQIEELVDFGDLPVFQGATTYPCILIVKNSEPTKKFRATEVKTLSFTDLNDLVNSGSLSIDQDSLNDDGWALVTQESTDILSKLSKSTVPLSTYIRGNLYYGVKTGLNEAFVIDRLTRDRLILEHESSREILRPFLRGRDIKRWVAQYQDLWLIFTRRGIDINRYPAIKRYLMQYKERLTPKPAGWKGPWSGRKPGSYQWYELQDTVDYFEQFEKPKLLVPDIALRANFAFDEGNNFYCVNTAYIIPTDDFYLLGILNSQLITYYYSNISPAYRGGYLRFINQYMMQIPIRTIDFTNPADAARHARMVELVERMLDLHKRHAAEGNPQMKTMLQRQIDATDGQIDALVYALYGLTEEEIAIVEGRA